VKEQYMSVFTDLIARAKALLAEIDGQAAADARGVVADLETSLDEAHSQALVLLGQAKTDISSAVAAATPEVQEAVNGLITKAEADIAALLGRIPGA
jgi:F0F1-type ATP synthase membrane subunit b/b'